ncbi:MAG: hypothetical protein JWM12_1405 [Ilumatobacteraceae bacterium]|jgi:hypothetical protein|nr:hypothetical protein [Ilumatobacteraceae bacterium]
MMLVGIVGPSVLLGVVGGSVPFARALGVAVSGS